MSLNFIFILVLCRWLTVVVCLRLFRLVFLDIKNHIIHVNSSIYVHQIALRIKHKVVNLNHNADLESPNSLESWPKPSNTSYREWDTVSVFVYFNIWYFPARETVLRCSFGLWKNLGQSL